MEKSSALKWNPPYTPPGEVDIYYINNILESLYGSPDPGCPDNPLDNLIFQLILKKTEKNRGIKIYNRLFQKLNGRWSAYYDITDELERDVFTSRFCDLFLFLKNILNEILEVFNNGISQSADKNKWLETLVSLPGVGSVTARLVMVYSLGFSFFPADSQVIRFLSRTGFLPPFIARNNIMVTDWLESKIPEKMREQFHRNIIAHCHKTCLEDKPNCKKCPVNLFCNFARGSEIAAWKKNHSEPSFVDLFCGAGGASLGLKSASTNGKSFRSAASADIDKWALKTYWLNHRELPADRVFNCDLLDDKNIEKILRVVEKENIILVVGGPPCQDFSLIGKKGRESARPVSETRFIDLPGSKNYRAFVGAVLKFRPRFFVMENVTGILAANGGIAGEEIKNDFSAVYECDYIVLDATSFGIPQTRKRVFFIGVKKDSDNDSLAAGVLKEIISRLQEISFEKVSLRQAIADLPPLESGRGKEFTPAKYKKGRPSWYQIVRRTDNGVLFNHTARPNNERDLILYRLLEPGEKASDVLKKYNRPELMIYRNDIFKDKYKKLHWVRPAGTIMAHLEKDGHGYIHPEQVRSITVREAARIQSFPDDFIFLGPRGSQFRQVGNAIPPPFAKKIGEIILSVFYKSYSTSDISEKENPDGQIHPAFI